MLQAVIPQSADSSTAQDRFTVLKEHLEHWYYQPDLQSLLITLAVGISHFVPEADPVWLFVMGPSGGGKTSINIRAASALPKTHSVSDLTENAILSGYHANTRKKTASIGLLVDVGVSGIVLMKDFTTILSKRDDERKKIIAALREIHDGHFDRTLGNVGKIGWDGKVTIIAATTQSLEGCWAVLRDMGERFIQVRTLRADGVAVAQTAIKQIGHEKAIAQKTVKLARQFIDFDSLKFTGNGFRWDAQFEEIKYLAEYVAHCRAPTHHPNNKIEAVKVGETEAPSRLMKAFGQIAHAYALMFRREIGEGELSAVRRVALDSVQTPRAKLLSLIPDDSDISRPDIVRLTGLANSSVGWIAAELEALKIIKVNNEIEHRYSFTVDFQELRHKSGLTGKINS
jgi:hypothetical protein